MLKVERFGAEYSVGVLGGFYLAGVIGNETAAEVAQDGLAASIIASGMITPARKSRYRRIPPVKPELFFEFLFPLRAHHSGIRRGLGHCKSLRRNMGGLFFIYGCQPGWRCAHLP